MSYYIEIHKLVEYLSLIWAQFCALEICYSVVSVNHLSCIQWRASNKPSHCRDPRWLFS